MGPGSGQKCPSKKSGSAVKQYDNGLALCSDCHTKRMSVQVNGIQSPRSGVSEDTAVKQVVDTDSVNMGNRDGLIMNPLLTYAKYGLSNSSTESVVKAMSGYYTLDEAMEAKICLWNKYAECLGDPKSRRDSCQRSELVAHIRDILDALKILDENRVETVIVTDAQGLSRLPKSMPEELNNICVVDRLGKLEERLASLEDTVSQNRVDSLQLKDSVAAMKAGSQQSFAEAVRGPVHNAISLLSHTQALQTGSLQHNTRMGDRGDTEQSAAIHQPSSDNMAQVRINQSDRGRPRGRGLASQRGLRSGRGSIPLGRRELSRDIVDMYGSNRSVKSIQQGSTTGGDEDGFQFPRSYRKKIDTNRKKVVKGTNTSAAIRGAPLPSRDLFVYRLDQDTTEDIMRKHLTDNGVTVRELVCTSHPNSAFKSFKLTVPVNQVDEVYKESLWPVGVCIRRYWKSRDKEGPRDHQDRTDESEWL